MKLMSVVDGKEEYLEEVNDEAFSQKMMGDGIAVVPSVGKVYAPASGRVSMLFPTYHAIGLILTDGVEVLIHIGIDTVELNGQYFESYVKQGDKVKKGDRLMKVDFKSIEKANYDITTLDVMVIITQLSQYSLIHKTEADELTIQDVILDIQ